MPSVAKGKGGRAIQNDFHFQGRHRIYLETDIPTVIIRIINNKKTFQHSTPQDGA